MDIFEYILRDSLTKLSAEDVGRFLTMNMFISAAVKNDDKKLMADIEQNVEFRHGYTKVMPFVRAYVDMQQSRGEYEALETIETIEAEPGFFLREGVLSCIIKYYMVNDGLAIFNSMT